MLKRPKQSGANRHPTGLFPTDQHPHADQELAERRMAALADVRSADQELMRGGDVLGLVERLAKGIADVLDPQHHPAQDHEGQENSGQRMRSRGRQATTAFQPAEARLMARAGTAAVFIAAACSR